MAKSDSLRIIDLLAEPESEVELISDIATEIDYLPLQTTKESLVGQISKIITRNNYIYILNRDNQILCFDRGGKYLRKLNKVGRGPGEYSFINDFDVSNDNSKLFILTFGKIMIFHNNETGFSFDKSIVLKSPSPSKLSLLAGTNNILLSVDPMLGSESSLSIIISINGDTIYEKPNHYRFDRVDKFTRGMTNESLQYLFEDIVCFKEEFSDTVFFVNKISIEIQPHLVLDSHELGLLPRIRYDSEYAKTHAGEIYWVYSIYETPRYILYTYEHNRTRNKILYDKIQNKKFQIAFKEAFIDDLSGGPRFDLNYCSEGIFYSLIDALALKKYFANGAVGDEVAKYPKLNAELVKLVDILDDTDNPILIIVVPKNGN